MVGYPLFYVVCFLVFVSWTFPFGKVRDRIVVSFNEGQRASGSSKELAIADISSSWVTGLRLTGVRLIDHDATAEPAAAEPAKGASEAKHELKIDSVVVRVALLPLLVGNHNVSFHADAFNGKIEGTFRQHGLDQDLDMSIEGVDIGQITPLTQLLEAPMDGSLGGTVEIELPGGKVAKASGSVNLGADDVGIGDGKAKLMGKLAVPRISLGRFSLTGEAKDGTLKITKLGASGKDVDFLADARIPLRDPLLESPVDANLRFRVSDTYRAKNDSTKALFGAPGSTIPGVLDLEPRMKQAKRADGFYAFHVRGPLEKMDFSPGGTGGPAAGPGGAGAAAAPRPKASP